MARAPETPRDVRLEPWDVGQLDHPIVKSYEPRAMGRGASQVVYEMPKHPDVVAKVNVGSISTNINWNEEHGLPLDELAPEMRVRAREFLKEEFAYFRTLQRHFGKEHVPNQRKILAKIPLTHDIQEDMWWRSGDKFDHLKISEAWALVTIQKKVEAITTSSYTALVADMGREGEEDFRDVLALSEQDPGLRVALKEFTAKAIDYSASTGQILDIFGKDNVIFFKEGERWTYSLIDALYGNQGRYRYIERIKEPTQKVLSDQPISEEEKNRMLNVYNYARNVNELAKNLGLNSQINITPGGVQIEDLLKKIHAAQIENKTP